MRAVRASGFAVQNLFSSFLFAAIFAVTSISATGSSATPRLIAATAPALSVNITDYGAKCDGAFNDKWALQAAISDVSSRGGGEVVIPQRACRVQQTATRPMTVLSKGVLVRGESSQSKLRLDTDDPAGYRQLFRISDDNVGIQNVVLERSAAVTGVMMTIEAGTNITLTSTVIDGKRDVYPGRYFHGISLNAGAGKTITNLNLNSVTMQNLDYAMYQASTVKGTTTNISVDKSTFNLNSADDLEFNSPAATMNHVTVSNSSFSNNKSTSVSSGYAVGVARVNNVQILNNVFNGYQNSPVHIESSSSSIQISNNTFVNSSTRTSRYAAHVFIISGTNNVAISGNTFDTAGNANAIECVYVDKGGSTLKPSDVNLSANTFKLRPLLVPWACIKRIGSLTSTQSFSCSSNRITPY